MWANLEKGLPMRPRSLRWLHAGVIVLAAIGACFLAAVTLGIREGAARRAVHAGYESEARRILDEFRARAADGAYLDAASRELVVRVATTGEYVAREPRTPAAARIDLEKFAVMLHDPDQYRIAEKKLIFELARRASAIARAPVQPGLPSP